MKTIRDVAAYSGVSLTTVSWVVNGPDKASPKTKTKVDQAIKELGYFPNDTAHSLIKRQTDSITILLRNIHDPFFIDLIRGIEDASATLRRNIIFCSPGKNEKVRGRYIECSTNGISDAIILYGFLFTDKVMAEHLQGMGFPFLLIEDNFQIMPVNQFLIDSVTGAGDAVNYFIRHSHRRITHVMGDPNKKVILERLNSYIETIQDNGLLIQDCYIQNTLGDSTLSPPRSGEMMSRSKDERPTAVLCSNDRIVIMVVNELTESGFKMPEDVSAVSFDSLNTYGFSYYDPRITSISQPLYQIGYNSIISIDGVLQGSTKTPISKFYPTTLEEHEMVCSL